MQESIDQLIKLCKDIINKYPFIQDKDIKGVRVVNDDDLLIMFKNGRNIVFDQSLYHLVVDYNPMIDENHIVMVNKLTHYDLLIEYDDGSKVIYDTLTSTTRGTRERYDLSDDYYIKRVFRFNLYKIMERKWMTQEELAKKVKTSQTMISHYMSGKCMPNAVMLKKLADALNCSVDDFFKKDI